MDYKRLLMYETNSKGDYVDYGEVVSVITDKLVNVNVGGQRNSDGSLFILESVAIEGEFVPKVGDWVGIEWRNGTPIAIGNSGYGSSAGLTNINASVKIVASTDLAGNVINAYHLKSDTIEARHIIAGAIQAEHISSNTIVANHIQSEAIESRHISANAIQAFHISANQIQGQHISANEISAEHLTVSARISGLLGQYFVHSGGINKFVQFKGTRIEPTLDFDWVSGSPSLVGQSDNYSLRLQGLIFAPEAGQYTFYVTSNDGAQLWIDNQLVCDFGVNQGVITLAQNRWNTIRIDYFENSGNASLKIEWKTPSGVREVIPERYLTQSETVIDGGTIITNSITAAQIKVGTITAESGVIADAAIGTANIQNGSITSAKIGTAEITSAHIASGSIGTVHIQSGSIIDAQIQYLSADKILSGTLTSDVIAAGSIQGYMISGNTITGDKIKANTIDSTQIKSGAITTGKLAAGSITGDRIAAGTITGDNIMANSIKAEHITTRGLDAQLVNVYNSETGQVLIGGGYIIADGMDVGVVQSDNLCANGLFLTASSSFGYKRNNPTGEAIIGSNSAIPGGSQVWKIDATTGEVINKINIEGKKPVGIAVDSTDTFAYVTVQGDNTLVQIDLQNNLVTDTALKTGTGPAKVIYTGDKLGDMKHFFVLNSDPNDLNTPDSLIIVDAPPVSINGDLYVHHWIPVGNGPYDIVMDNTKKSYITHSQQGDILVIDHSPMTSKEWRVIGSIPIAAFGTDNYHGGLPGFFGLNQVTGGDSSGQYDASVSSGVETESGSGHQHGGYGSSSGTLKRYEPHGIAQSADPDTLYVADFANGELVVIDKYGNAPYNALTGRDNSAESPQDSRNGDVSEGGGPKTPYVRYRIPVGDAPDFVEVVNGKIFITLQGSGKMAIIDESDILNEINADRAYYGDHFDPTAPMRPNSIFVVRTIPIGSKPSLMSVKGSRIAVTLSGQNQVVIVDSISESVISRLNTGPSPKGVAISGDGTYLYVVNYGGSGELSFVYPSGPFIGDPYLGLEGTVEYQGAEYWIPDRSEWVHDASGNIIASSTVEFRINEPFLNEGGYARLTAYGKEYQYAQIEQDIYNVTNYSNGNNVIDTVAETLIPNEENNKFFPKSGEWLDSPVPHDIKVYFESDGAEISYTPNPSEYTVYYGGASRLEFIEGIVPSGGWVKASYRARNDLYFKPHNASVLIAIENSSSENFDTYFEVDEFVPKFIVVDNQQTGEFTPIEDGVNEEYTGLEYSMETNRARGALITASAEPIDGTLDVINDDVEITSAEGDVSMNPAPSTFSFLSPFQIAPSTAGLSVKLPSGLQFITLDLGAKYMVGQVFVSHKFGEDRVYHNTKTEVSEDGLTWFAIYNSAVSGEYNEKPTYHPDHDHTHYGKMITFDARPVRYIRDYANGWTSGDGTVSEGTNDWCEIKAFADWQLEESYVFPENSEKAGQQIATNGKGFVTTDVHGAYVAMDIQTEFTTWWYMTYITGPQFGKLAIEMPTLINSDHYLFLDSPYVNKMAHRHTMSFPPSYNIKADPSKGVKEGKHRAIIRQESGKVSIDRFRFEDFQYLTRSSTLVTNDAPASFTRYKIVAEQAKWYEGTGRQSTFGAYDTPRANPDTGIPDKSVPIKYRVRVRSELSADGTQEERGIAYVTSAITETGKLSTHWRRSEAQDSFPGSRIETWDGNQPHKTGIQHYHLANGAVRGPKILPAAIMDYHISPYAKIEEYKLNLNHPTHRHGKMEIHYGAGHMGEDVEMFVSNLDFLDQLEGFEGISGNYGVKGTVARGDHKHPYLALTGGTVIGNVDIVGSLTIGGNPLSSDWNSITNKPVAYPPTLHTHVPTDIEGLEELMLSAGDIKADNENIFKNINTFNNAGLSVLIQPSANVVNTTLLMQIANYSGNNLVTVNHGGDVLIKGNLTVQGVTQYAGTTEVNGDYGINGNLTVDGDTILGGTNSNQTTVNGKLLLSNQAYTNSMAVRADRSISTGAGLSGGGSLVSNRTLSVIFGGNGSADSAARSDHNHDSTYLGISGTAANALKLGGLDVAKFVRSDTSGSINGSLNVTNGTQNQILTKVGTPNINSRRTVILLHQIYAGDGVNIGENHCIGSLFASRGNGGAMNRKSFADIKTGSSFNSIMGTLKSYQERYKLVTCMYNGVKYMAVEIPYSSSPYANGIYFSGIITSTAPEKLLMIEYYDVQSSTALNAEINGSIADYNSTMNHYIDANALYVGTNAVIHAGTLNTSNLVYKNTANQGVTGSFIISGNGQLFVGAGTAGTSGMISVKNGTAHAIQLDGGNTGKLTGVNSYIDGLGNATFAKQISAESLVVTSELRVDHLNAEMINGVKEDRLAKNESIRDVAGTGIYSGFEASQKTIPNMSVTVNSGTVYTDTGKRVEVTTQTVALTSSSNTYDRIDVIYVRGSSEGLNEGSLGLLTGSPASTPAVPAVPSDGIPVAKIYVKKNIGTILNADITDIRKWKEFLVQSGNSVFKSPVLLDSLDAASSSAKSISIAKPLKGNWATSISIPAGQTSATWTHNLGITTYAMVLSVNSPNRHVYWSAKSANSIVINIDDAADASITVDAVIIAI